MRNRKLSKEHLDIVLTRILSDDHKAAVKKARTNSTHSADARAKMINFIHSEETKAKLSQRLTNYNLSKGHKIEITNIVENTNTVYESIRKAAISLNTNHNTIRSGRHHLWWWLDPAKKQFCFFLLEIILKVVSCIKAYIK
jgi:hypothetical protein